MARTNAQISRRELLRRRRQRFLATLLVLLAGLMLPLGAHMLADYSEAAALILPSVVLTAAIAVLCPQWIIPPLAIVGMYAVELIAWGFQRQRAEPNVLERLLDGHLDLLWVPLAALVMGWLLVVGRRRLSGAQFQAHGPAGGVTAARLPHKSLSQGGMRGPAGGI